MDENALSSTQASLFASHSFSLGHLFFARFPSQSPQMVMSWLQGIKSSELRVLVVFLASALFALWIRVTFGIRRFASDRSSMNSKSKAILAKLAKDARKTFKPWF